MRPNKSITTDVVSAVRHLGLILRSIVLALLIAGTAINPTYAGGFPKMEKKFKLTKEQIKHLADGYGGCIASDKITVEGLPVRFMYKEKPDNAQDSGWRFLSGTESDEYMADAKNHAFYDVNTIANYDPSIIPFLKSPAGSVYEKITGAKEFKVVTDWRP